MSLINHFMRRAAAESLIVPHAPGSALALSPQYAAVAGMAYEQRQIAEALLSARTVQGYRADCYRADSRDDDRSPHERAMDHASALQWAMWRRGARNDMADARMDAMVPMASQGLTFIYSDIYEIGHANLPAWDGEYLEKDRRVDPAAEDYAWYEMDLVGTVRAANTYDAMSIPLVGGPAAQANKGRIVPALCGIEINFMDARRAAMARAQGKPDFQIDRNKTKAAQRVIAEFANALWLYGDATLGIDGLHNSPLIQILDLGGAWSGKTGQQIMDDLNRMINTPGNSTQGRLADRKKITICLPNLQYQRANALRVSAAGNMSVLAQFKVDHGLRDDQVKQMYDLTASNSAMYIGGPLGLARDRAVVIYKDGDIDSDPVFVEPQPIEVPAPPRQNGLSETTFFHARFGGLKLPDAQRVYFFENL